MRELNLISLMLCILVYVGVNYSCKSKSDKIDEVNTESIRNVMGYYEIDKDETIRMFKNSSVLAGTTPEERQQMINQVEMRIDKLEFTVEIEETKAIFRTAPLGTKEYLYQVTKDSLIMDDPNFSFLIKGNRVQSINDPNGFVLKKVSD